MTSLKKLIAVLAISLPLAAMAQQAAAPAADKPPVAQVYGTLNLNLQRIGAMSPVSTAAGIQSRWAVSADSSNIGIKGTAAVADGLSVVYQCESDAKLDGTGTSAWCTRNSRVGLTHATYGTLFFGNWDTPLKALYYGTKADDPFGSTDVFGANNMLGSPGFRTKSGDASGFDIRSKNSVAYWTPKIMGISGRAQVSVDENADARYHGNPAAKQLDPWLWSVAVNYDQGPLSLGAAFEQHRDLQGLQAIAAVATAVNGLPAQPGTPANWSGLDQAWRLSAGYEVPLPMGPLTVAVVYETLKFSTRFQGTVNSTVAVPVLQEVSRPAWGLSAKQRMGDNEFRARFNWADKGSCKMAAEADGTVPSCETSGLDAHQVTLGYAYYLAASTQVYAFYEKIMNGRGATYVPGAGGSLSGAPAIYTISAGADPEAYGVGIRYAF